jgi:hypothetical protein
VGHARALTVEAVASPAVRLALLGLLLAAGPLLWVGRATGARRRRAAFKP